MKRAVFVRVSGTGPEGERLESGGSGTEEVRPDGTRVIAFREELPGADGPVEARLELSDGRVVLVREGALACRLVFAEGQTHPADYRTPYGAIRMSTAAQRLTVRFGSRETFAAVRYRLLFEDGTAREGCRVSVRVSAVTEGV